MITPATLRTVAYYLRQVGNMQQADITMEAGRCWSAAEKYLADIRLACNQADERGETTLSIAQVRQLIGG